jgi:hypothetical protein
LLRGAGGRDLSSDSVGRRQREASGGASAAGGARRGVGVCGELDRGDSKGGLASDRPAREMAQAVPGEAREACSSNFGRRQGPWRRSARELQPALLRLGERTGTTALAHYGGGGGAVGARLDMAGRGDVRARLCASCLRARRGTVCMRVCVSCVQPSASAMCVGASRPASTRWLGLVRAMREEGLARVCRRGRGLLKWWWAQRKAVGHERASCGHGESAGRGSETHSGYKSHHPSLCNACRVEME